MAWTDRKSLVRRRLKPFFFPPLIVIATLSWALEARAGDPSATSAVFQRLNAYRDKAMLSRLISSPELNLAAQAHADYLNTNNAFSHYETPGLPGYVGQNVAERVAMARYAWSRLAEAMEGGSAGAAGVDGLMAAIYHRFLLLSPSYTEVGIGVAAHLTYEQVQVIDLALPQGAMVPSNRIAVYPADGQEWVPTSFNSDSEMPDPAPNLGSVGYPVSIHFSEDYDTTLVDMQLFEGDVPLDLVLLDGDTDPYVPKGYAVMATADLSPNTHYDALVRAQVNGRDFQRMWSFSTGVRPTVAAAFGNFDQDVRREFVIATRLVDGTVRLNFFDDEGSLLGVGWTGKVLEMSLATGNFDMDTEDEAVLACVQEDGTLATLVFDAFGNRLFKGIGGPCSHVKVAAGQFDTKDSQHEYAVALRQQDGTLAVIIFQADGTRVVKAVGGPCLDLDLSTGNFDDNPNDDEFAVALLQANGSLGLITFQGDGSRIAKGTGGSCSNIALAAGDFLADANGKDEVVVSLLQWEGSLAAIGFSATGARFGKGTGGFASQVRIAAGKFSSTSPGHGYVLSVRQSDRTPALIFFTGKGIRLAKHQETQIPLTTDVACGDVDGDGRDEVLWVHVDGSSRTRWALYNEWEMLEQGEL